MKKFWMMLAVLVTCLSLFSTVAEAKRFGGGSSFGKQRSVPTRQAQQQAPEAPKPAPAAAPAAPAGGNKWLGPLAGLAIGAGLASLFAGSGMGGMMGPILLGLLAIGAVMFFVGRMNKTQRPAMQYAGAGAPYSAPEPLQPVGAGSSAAIPAATAQAGSIPADFPTEAFLRNGKASFIRLQAANDRKDQDDVRQYTTPEMFAEIVMQMQERGDAPQKTDVMSLHADLLDVAMDGDYQIASVRFSAMMSENGGAPESVNEIWHVQKDMRDDKAMWLLAGIQQVELH